MTFQRLANAQLVIRPFEPADADEFVRAAHESIDTVGKWMSWCSHSLTRDSALEWFASCEQDCAAGRAHESSRPAHIATLQWQLDKPRSTPSRKVAKMTSTSPAYKGATA